VFRFRCSAPFVYLLKGMGHRWLYYDGELTVAVGRVTVACDHVNLFTQCRIVIQSGGAICSPPRLPTARDDRRYKCACAVISTCGRYDDSLRYGGLNEARK